MSDDYESARKSYLPHYKTGKEWYTPEVHEASKKMIGLHEASNKAHKKAKKTGDYTESNKLSKAADTAAKEYANHIKEHEQSHWKEK
jgi:hypothetical protein